MIRTLAIGTAFLVGMLLVTAPASARIKSGINVNDAIAACERDVNCSYNIVDDIGSVSGQTEHGTFVCTIIGAQQGAQSGPKGSGFTCVYSEK